MLLSHMISGAGPHPGLSYKPGSKGHKYPQYLAHALPIFGHRGLFVLEHKIDPKQQGLFLVGVVCMLIFLTFFNLYPFWMQQYIWTAFCGYCLGLMGIASLRLALYCIAQHLGLTLWLFPSFRKSYFNPMKSLLPVASVNLNDTMFNPVSVVFRLVSISFVGYIVHNFMSD